MTVSPTALITRFLSGQAELCGHEAPALKPGGSARGYPKGCGTQCATWLKDSLREAQLLRRHAHQLCQQCQQPRM